MTFREFTLIAASIPAAFFIPFLLTIALLSALA